MKKRFGIVTTIGLCMLAAAVTFTVTYLSVFDYFNAQLKEKTESDALLEKITTVLGHIEDSYVGDYELEALVDGALRGIVRATGDQWSYYLTEEEYASLQQSIANEYVGIGVSTSGAESERGILVSRVHPGSSAEEAGLQPRDLIVAVDGERVEDIGYAEAVAAVRGAEGTVVTLGVLRYESGEEETIQLRRRSYVYNAVTSEILDGNVGYVRIENFDSYVNINFEDAVAALRDAGVEGFVFDVRTNPGGKLSVLERMLDFLLPEGRIFLQRDKAGNEAELLSDADCLDMPMVVLINGSSVSAAEYFAAALSEYDWAELVGTDTLGKGYAQEQIDLKDGTALNLSTREYFTPKGNSLIGVGVAPDYRVELTEEQELNLAFLPHEEDDQLMTGLSVVKQEIERRAPAPETEPPEEDAA